jgi:signal transduction histidine kinase
MSTAGTPGTAWRSLRVRLAVLGALAIYLPVLLLFGVTVVTEDERVESTDGRVEVTDTTTSERSPWRTWTVVALAPAAGALAWWWAGRAVRPLDRVRAVAEDIEATDLGRRIGLDRGPTEVVALASSFDAMLDRLERAADTQRRLVEETSHELRTPLAVLTTNAEVLLADQEPTLEAYRRGLERSRTAAARMQATIDDLLVDARGRARSLDRRPADLVAIVRGVVDAAGVLAAAEGVTIAVSGPASAIAPVDEATVARAVSNLVDNAVRHAPPDSTVEVDVEVRTERGDGGYEAVAIAVTDHGPGVPAHDRDRIFERFWRGRAGGGTGLGLPIARQIALAHGGDLTVRSPAATGDGSTFTLTVRR